MSILNEVSKIFESTASDGQHQNLVAEAVMMLTCREGGLNALKQNFEQDRPEHIISSWIGTERMQPFRPTKSSPYCVANLATKAGISPETATQYLTKTLPHLVDALTPNGRIGGANDLLSRGKEILAAFASKKGG